MQVRPPSSPRRIWLTLFCVSLALWAGDAVRAHSAGAIVAAPQPVWIDTDPAVGEKDRDVDDGLALVQAFHSPELVIRGVSVVFGNAPLAAAVPIARALVEQLGPKGLAVYAGAAAAKDRGVPTPASEALAAALSREPLSILLLGPATNLATVLLTRPALAARIRVVVAVAGRRPGQRFTTGTFNPRGHRDFNFEQDPEAFAVLLAQRVPLVLTPFEISSQVWLTAADLTGLAGGGAAGRYLAGPARSWLHLWQQVFQVDGFNPFDTLAVGYLTHPRWFACTMLTAGIERHPDDATDPRMQGSRMPDKPYLLVRAPASPQSATVQYCSSVHHDFKPELLRRLTAGATLQESEARTRPCCHYPQCIAAVRQFVAWRGRSPRLRGCARWMRRQSHHLRQIVLLPGPIDPRSLAMY